MHTALLIWWLWASVPENFSVTLSGWDYKAYNPNSFTQQLHGYFIKHFTCVMHGAKYFYINSSFMRAKLMADLKELDEFDCYWKTYILGSSKISQRNPNGEKSYWLIIPYIFLVSL